MTGAVTPTPYFFTINLASFNSRLAPLFPELLGEQPPGDLLQAPIHIRRDQDPPPFNIIHVPLSIHSMIHSMNTLHKPHQPV